MAEYSVFISHARQDLDRYLDQFIADLTAELRQGNAEDVRVFADREISAGSDWSPRVEEALRSSRVMMPIITPQYLTTASTGQEWELFRRRGTDEGSLSIVPVLWTSMDFLPTPLPAAIERIQLVSYDFPEVYSEHGLQTVMKLRKYRDAYGHCLNLFAEHVTDLLHRSPVTPPMNLPRLDTLPSAFATASDPLFRRTEETGPRHLRCVIIAPTRAQMGALREGTEAYGDTAAEWRPFYPDIEDSAADLVQQIAAGGRYFCHILPDGPELMGALDDAAKNGNLVCVIVDPWAARLKQLRGMLRKVDTLPHANIALLALWNEADPETQDARPRLDEALQQALSGREEQRRGVVSVSSAQQFQAELASTLEHLRMEVIVQSTPLLMMDASARPAIERIDLGSAWA